MFRKLHSATPMLRKQMFNFTSRGISSSIVSKTSLFRTANLQTKLNTPVFTSIRLISSDSESNAEVETSPRIAVVLSGCGVFDGSEITEAVSTLVHISAAGMRFACFAPDIPSYQVIDHTRGEPEDSEQSPRRNVYRESARIARGKILPLSDLDVGDFDAMIFPGGFGVAKNLSNFAVKGHEMEVLDDVSRVVKEFHANGKPMGFMCISPIIPSCIFGPDVAVTVGGDADDNGKWPFHGAAHAIEAMGSKHIVTSLDQICIDKSARIVSSAAYMSGDAKPHQVFDNIGKLVDAVHEMILIDKSTQ